MRCRFLRGRQLCAAWVRAGLIIWRDTAGDDQRHATTGAFGIERCHPLEAVVGFLEPNVHRTHKHAVRQRDENEIKWLKQVRIEGIAWLGFRHGCSLLGV